MSSVSFVVPGYELARAVKRVRYAATQPFDGDREAVKGVMVYTELKDILLATTDVYRLAVVRVPAEYKEYDVLSAKLHLESLEAAIKQLELAKKRTGPAEVRITDSGWSITVAGVRAEGLCSRAIDKDLVDRVVDWRYKSLAIVPLEELGRAIKEFPNKKLDGVRLGITDSKVVLASEDELQVSVIESPKTIGPDLYAEVSTKYLDQAVRHCTGDSVRIRMSGALEQIRLDNPAEPEWFHIVMPRQPRAGVLGEIDDILNESVRNALKTHGSQWR